MSRIPVVRIVELHQPKIVAEYNMWGGVDIKMDDFTFVQIHYDHRYTHNAHRKAAADHVLKFLGVDPNAEGVNVSAPIPASWAAFDDAELEYKSWLAALSRSAGQEKKENP